MKVTPVTGLFGFVLGGFLLSLLLGAIEFVLKPKQDNSSKLEVRTQRRISLVGNLYLTEDVCAREPGLPRSDIVSFS